jgi:4-hydroxy-tetrahydrodipicolinate synthase
MLTRTQHVAPASTSPVPLRGIIAASVTPVLEDFSIDVPRLATHVAWLLAHACDMVSVFGTTGEGTSFPVEMRNEALRGLVAAGLSPQRIIPAVMTSAAVDARSMVAAATALGCRSVLLLPPYYYGADDTGIAAFVAAAMGPTPMIDMILYHIPAMSRFAFSADLVAALSDAYGSRLAGIKDSTGDTGATIALARRFPKLAVFTGTDTDLVPLLAAGGAGIIGGIPNVNARTLRQMLDAGAADQPACAAQVASLLQAVIAYGGPMPIKTLVAHQHGDPAWLRAAPPLRPQPEADRAALVERFLAAGFMFPADVA